MEKNKKINKQNKKTKKMKKQKLKLNEEIFQIKKMMKKINEQLLTENIDDTVDFFEKSEDIDNIEVKVANINFDNENGHMLFASNGEFSSNKN